MLSRVAPGWEKSFEKWKRADGSYGLLCFRCWNELGQPEEDPPIDRHKP
jgi:hypothetical protein